MASSTLPLALPVDDDPLFMVNDLVSFRDFDGVRVVLVDGNLFYRYALGNRDEEAFVLGTLALCGLAGPVRLGRAFGVDRATVYRHRRRLEEEGARGVLPRKPGPKGPHTVTPTVRKRILGLKEQGLSNRAAGRRLGISERSVRRALDEAGYRRPEPPSLPGIEDPEKATAREDLQEVAPAEKVGRDSVVATGRPVAEAIPPRDVERVLARFGKILEAPAVPESGTNLRSAGVLLAVPAILDLGVLDCAFRSI
jgi:transposase